MSGKSNGKTVRGFIRYEAYFFRGQDPAVGELLSLARKKYGRLDGKAFRAIHDNGGPTPSCLGGWASKKVRSPRNQSLEATGRSMGLKRVWVDHRPNR